MTILSVESKEKLKSGHIDDRDIVQIDATVIAGVLIFLGVLTVVTDDLAARNVIESQLSGVLLASFFIIPFGASAMLGLLGQTKAAIVGAITGFGLMIFVIIVLAGSLIDML